MGAYELSNSENRQKVDRLLADAAANGGLAPVDLDQFWSDQQIAQKDPFGADIPQVVFGASCSWECIFDEFGI